jgi:hypothetical protein
MLIAVVNQSTLVKDADVVSMCSAVQTQLDLHVAPAWHQKSATVRPYTNTAQIPGYAWIVNLLDNSTQAGALGYHSIDNDKIDAFIFASPVLSNSGVVLYDPSNPQNTSVSSVLSHEVLEMFGDRFANFWADGPAVSQGSEYALELCDPVENDSYAIDANGAMVSVSNFVFPAYFNYQATVKNNFPFDYLHKLQAPFGMTAGGYLIVRKAGVASQIFAQDAEQMKGWRREMKKSKFSRMSMRTR